MANYPSSVPSFATRNAGDVVQPSHVNTLGDEVTAIGNGLLNGLAHAVTTNGQVVFPATQNPSTGANTLDDYEEGVWTPTLGGVSGTSGQTYSNQTGSYVKVGKEVFVHGVFALSTLGTLTGNVAIMGLPFACGNADADRGGLVITFFNNLVTAMSTITAVMDTGATYATIYCTTGAATASVATAQANYSNTTSMHFFGHYRAVN